MNRIYSFESKNPPRLTEKMLRQELARRKLRRQTALLLFASYMTAICLILFAFLILPDSLILAIVSVVILGYFLVGSGVVAVVFFRKGRHMNNGVNPNMIEI